MYKLEVQLNLGAIHPFYHTSRNTQTETHHRGSPLRDTILKLSQPYLPRSVVDAGAIASNPLSRLRVAPSRRQIVDQEEQPPLAAYPGRLCILLLLFFLSFLLLLDMSKRLRCSAVLEPMDPESDFHGVRSVDTGCHACINPRALRVPPESWLLGQWDE